MKKFQSKKMKVEFSKDGKLQKFSLSFMKHVSLGQGIAQEISQILSKLMSYTYT